MKKKFLFLMTLVLMSVVVASCGKKVDNSNIVVYNLGADPKSIDPQINTTTDGSTVIMAVFEGLFAEDNSGATIPAVAQDVVIAKDNLHYTFKLREDAKWSDGKPVTAHDFEYAWKRGLDPKTASSYASQFYYIKNGEKFNKGEATAEDVGVKATDDTTLEVELEAPTPYFIKLTTTSLFFPVRKDIVEANPTGWTNDTKTYIGNGPFKLAKINPKENFELVKSDTYYDKANVKLDGLKFTVIEDSNTYLNSFKTGEIDIIDGPPPAETPSLLADGTAKTLPLLGTYFFVINVSGKNMSDETYKFLRNRNVRRALTLAIDRNALIENVTKSGQTPATAYVPFGITDSNGKTFAGKSYFKPEGDIEEAKRLMKEAGYDDPSKIPTISFIFNTSSTNAAVAEAVQDMWKKNLGVNIELKNLEWAVYVPTRNNHEYEIGRHTWLADYNDPMTFLDMWVTGNGNNAAGYDNPEYDKLIKLAKNTKKEDDRIKYLHTAEDILMADLPIIPLYYYVSVVCVNPNVKDYYKTPLGTYNFKNAYKEKAAK